MSDERGAILARRRRFLVLALAGVGCATTPKPAETLDKASSESPVDAGEKPAPALDTDGDGFLDEVDPCPEVAGESGGCPRPCLMIVERQHIEILEHVYFAPGAAEIRPESFPVLDAIAEALKGNPELRVEVSGHTAGGESDALAPKRAEKVRDYLVNHGVAAERMETQSYAKTRPLGREPATNRRVDFTVLEE